MKKDSTHVKVFDAVEEGLNEINRIKPIPTSIREFNKVKYEKVKEYGPDDIIRLRRTRLGSGSPQVKTA